MRLTIPDLLPGTNYAIEVAAVSRTTGHSEWSNTLYVTTDVDARKPDMPTNVTWVSSGDNFHGEWDSVSTNEQGETIKIDRYEVELVAGGLTRNVSVMAQEAGGKITYDLSFEANRALFTTPRPVVAMRVRAVNVNKVFSEWTTAITATNPAPAAPTAPAVGAVATGGVDSIALAWTPPADLDLIGYHVYVGTTAGFAPALNNRIYAGDATRFTYTTLTYTTQHFKIKAVDKFGQESPELTGSAQASSSFTADVTAPNVPTGLTAPVTNNASLTAASAAESWTMTSPPADLAGFYVRWRQGTSGNYNVESFAKDDRAAVIQLPTPYASYEFQIKAYDWSANESAWSSTVTGAASTNTAPAQTAGVTVVTSDGSLIVSWNEATEVDVKAGAGIYELQIAKDSAFTDTNRSYKTGANSITITGLDISSLYYIRVRAIDSQGAPGQTWSTTSGPHRPVGTVRDYIQSRGNDLVANGTAFLGTNYNFSWATLDKTDAPIGAAGSFDTVANTNATVTIDELVPIDTSKSYRFSFQMKQKNVGPGYFYGFFRPFDAYKQAISPQHIMFEPNTLTTLAAPLNPGDTTATLTSTANWCGQAGKLVTTATHRRSFIFWDYVDAGGKTWGPETYSRNVYLYTYEDNAINGNVITLNAPWAGPAKAAGTQLSNGSAGGTYIYMPGVENIVAPTDWTRYTEILRGQAAPGKWGWNFGIPIGTAYGSFGWLVNRTSPGASANPSKHSVAAVSVSEAQAKSSVRIENYIPTTEPNLKGDIWFYRDGTGTIIGQYEGMGGTSWTVRQVSDSVIANVSAGKLTAGTITSTTINIGVGGTLNVDATGVIKSNNWANNSTGYRLDSSGLQVNDGSIDAKALRAGSAIIGDITVGRSADALGEIKSFGYTAGSAGFRLHKTGLEINDGAIAARAIRLQVGENIMPYNYGTMWLPITSTPVTLPDSTITASMDTTSFNYGPQSMKLTKTTAVTKRVGFTTSDANNITVPELGAKYIVSMWIRPPDTSPVTLEVYNGASSHTSVTAKRVTDDATTLVANTWQRVYMVTNTVNVVGLNVRVNLAAVIGDYRIDAVQVERQLEGNTSGKPSEWKPPSVTSIDGGMIKTGSIISNQTVDIDGTPTALWSIPMDGNATFAGMRVLGNTVVGKSATDDDSIMQSANYIPGTSGWIVRGSGEAEFLQLKSGSVRADALMGGTDLNANITLKGSLTATGLLGESLTFSNEGLKARGAHEAGITSWSVDLVGSDYIVTLNTTDVHKYPVGGPIYVKGISDVYDGRWQILAVPTITSLTYKYAGSNGATTPLTTSVKAKVMGNTGDESTRPINVNFHTDGTLPNIVSGTTLSDVLIVEESATLGGQSLIPANATLQIASSMQSPTADADITYSQSKVAIGGTAEYVTGQGQLEISDTMWGSYRNPSNTSNVFILSSAYNSTTDQNHYKISEHKVSDGSLVAVRRSFLLDAATLGFQPVDMKVCGLVVTSAFALVGIAYTDTGQQRKVGYMYIPTTTANGATPWVGQGVSFGPAHGSTERISSATIGYNENDNRVIFAYLLPGFGPQRLGNKVATARLYEYNVNSTGTLSFVVVQDTVLNVNFGDIRGIVRGNFGYNNAERYIAYDRLPTTSNSFLSFSTTGAPIADEHFGDAGDHGALSAISYHGTENVLMVTESGYSTDSSIGSLVKYPCGTEFVTSPATGGNVTKWIAYSYYDSRTGKETEGKVIKTTQKTRAYPTITVPTIPVGDGTSGNPNSARIYTATSVSQPAPTSSLWRRRTTIMAPSRVSIITNSTGAGTVATLATTNGFAGSGGVGEIVTTSGKSFWRGDDSAQFFQLVVTSSEDVDLTSTNKPPLVIGTPASSHLRIDGNEIYSMSDPTTPGPLGIQGKFIKAWNWSSAPVTVNLNASGNGTVTHGLGSVPGFVSAIGYNMNNFRHIQIMSKTATTFTINVKDSTGANVDTTCDIYWFAIATGTDT